MFVLQRTRIKRLRINFSRWLGITARSSGPTVEFQVINNRLSIRAEKDGVGIEYRAECQSSDTRFTVPFELLREIETQRTKLACFYSFTEDGQVSVRWDVDGKTTVQLYPLSCAGDDQRSAPQSQSHHDADLLAAVRQAMATTTDSSIRFAIEKIEIDGTDGCITGTNGHELYNHRGFDFSFKEQLLVPKNSFFNSSELDSSESVSVGLGPDNTWITFDFGRWAIQLPIDRVGRFPNFRQVIPPKDAGFTMLNVSEPDANQLINSLDALPAVKEENSPITVDMNGKVCIRARAMDERTSTETRLTTSTSEGPSSCFRTNRKLLSRAARLGFRRIEFFIDQSKLCCRDDRRIYLWMTLSNGESATANVPNPISVNDRIHQSTPVNPSNQGRKTITMTKESQTNGSQPKQAERSTPMIPDPALLQRSVIEQAELVRSSLAESLVTVRTLITTLKRRKKQSRLVRSTLASLRELETTEV